MNTKLLMTFVLIVCGIANIWADKLSEKQAMELAQQFVSGQLAKSARGAKAPGKVKQQAQTIEAAGQVSGLYVFNVTGDGGFVIVSNDDSTTPILGFGESGSIDPNDLPDNMAAWLQGYADQIAWLQQQDKQTLNAKINLSGGIHNNIKPLIQTHWNQSKPYYNRCPKIDGMMTVTGCVATTMAQLINYHQYPTEACSAVPGYSFNTKDKDKKTISMTVDTLLATTFDWNNMIANYTPLNPETGKRELAGTFAEQEAVATLMQYCGYAIHMIYGLSQNGGSSAYGEAIPYALKNIFGFDGGVRHCYRKNYSYEEWVNLIYNELAGRRPVALGGQSCGGGHSFICDGYKYENETDYFHINWGWGGSSDDYFVLSVLQPWEQGIGGSSTLDGFSYSQDAVIGIRPPVDNNADYCLSLEGLHLGGDDATKSSQTFDRDGETGGFNSISIFYSLWNYNYGNSAYDAALQLVDGSGNAVLTSVTAENQAMNWNDKIQGNIFLTIPSDVADGTYYIKVMSRPHGEANWQESFDGDAYRLTAVISDDGLTINVPIPKDVYPSATLAVTGNLTKGTEQTVTASFSGTSGAYNGNVVLRVNGTSVMGKTLNIAEGGAVEMQFSFIPKQGGNNTLALYDSRTGGTKIGTETEVNIIDVLTLANTEDNSTAISTANGNTANVTLDGRTLYKDGDWNTLCLPFDLSNFTGTPLEGATVKTLTSSSFNSETGSLTLTFSDDLTAIEAGKPYIVKWASGANIVNPAFQGVVVSNAEYNIETTNATFTGSYDPILLTGGDRSVLYLGSSNKLYFPASDSTIGACRAHFQLKGITAGDPASSGEIKAFVMNFDEDDADGIGLIQNSKFKVQNEGEGWYDLSGRKLSGKPEKGGTYIHNGKKVLY